MIYLVDGHNLIPKIPGLSLQAENDELQLIEVLQVFAREKRKKVEVYFDRAAQGQAGTRKFGTITAHFVVASSSADQAIRTRLEKTGRQSSEYQVVSSDRAVQSSARAYHAQVQSSEEFVKDFLALVGRGEHPPSERQERRLSESEVDDWMRVFSEGRGKKAK
jgi:uncharacterized protein